MTARADPLDGPEWFGQPRGLTVLFLTEMWEKFSYFGMRAMLVYYMTKQLMIAQGPSSLIYGLYTASVFLTPLLGAAVSDRWLGRRKAVILGSVTMAFGHFMMAFEPLFFPALGVLAIGSGFFLPNLPSQIDSLYRPDDPRRGSAYNVYYVGINVGALLAPLVCGTIGELYGWHWGFSVAGVGMLVGLLIYLAGGRYLPKDVAAPRPVPGAPQDAPGSPASLGTLLAIALIVVLLRGSYEQIGNTVALWTADGVDRTVTAAFTVPMTWFQSLNPALVFLLTPIFVAHWIRQGGRGRERSPMGKMAAGAAMIAAAWFVLAPVALAAASQGVQVGWPWLVLFFVMMTAGELYIFPIGLSLFARSAPGGLVATAIAVWYLGGFAGNLLAGALGSLLGAVPPAAFFGAMGLLAATAALLFAWFDRRTST